MTPRISLVYVGSYQLNHIFLVSNFVQGAAIFGAVGTNGARLHIIPDCQAMVDLFDSHGHSEYDTANRYCEGTSEQVCETISL